MSEVLIAVILGLVEGVTEYLPVSSTGHLLLMNELLKFDDERARTFDIVIQGGAIFGIVLLYWNRFRSLFGDSPVNRDILRAIAGRGDARKQLMHSVSQPGLFGNAGLIKLAVATVPPSIVGIFAHQWIKEYLFAPLPVAVALLVGAAAMFWAESQTKGRGRDADTLTMRDALFIGLFQCIALWPGMSRAAWTILGGMIVGLSRRSAAEFSFLAAVPVILGASVYDLWKNIHFFSATDFIVLAVGLAVSFITATLTVAFFMNLVQRVSLRPFAVYRIMLGVLVLALAGV